MMETPDIRIRLLNDASIRKEGEFVLYWMVANRRVNWNFSLQRAVEHCAALDKPLLVFEALRTNYRWASDRLHRFVIQGMADNKRSLSDSQATYYPYVEPEPNAASGLLEELANRACIVVTDDFPCFFIPTMLRWVSRKVSTRMEAVDSNGLLPMRAADKVFPTAYAFRRFLQKTLPEHLSHFPKDSAFRGISLPELDGVPSSILKRWPAASADLLTGDIGQLASLEIDHTVGPASFDGGTQAAAKALQQFLSSRLHRYADDRNNPDNEAASGFSPYLHFGHLSSHEVFFHLAKREGWSIDSLGDHASGKREGWWGMSPATESFLDELITWREVGYNMCSQRRDYDKFESLPDWARKTLEEHANDPREQIYSLEELEHSKTSDEIWNAAQRELVRDGRMQNYLRMLWGKKILGWTEHPRQALDFMIELNNKYAVDGRNPNSYSGIFWCLGRYDRPWGPERQVFGKIRYMTSDSTRRKLPMSGYLERYGDRSGRLF